MYKVKQKKTWSVLGFITAFLALAAIGLGIGYAGARLTHRTPEGEYVRDIPKPSLEPTPADKTSALASKIISDEPQTTIAPKENFKYLIKLEAGTTKVFNLTDGKQIFSHTLPIEPNSLRKEDLTLLKNGIFLKTKEELLSFTEDFCS